MFKIAGRIWAIIIAFSFISSMGISAAIVGISSVGALAASVYDAVTGTASAFTQTKEKILKAERKAVDLTHERNLLKAEALELKTERNQAIERSQALFEEVEVRKTNNQKLTDKIIRNEARIANLEKKIRTKEGRIAVLANDLLERDDKVLTLKKDASKRVDKVIYRGTSTSFSDAVIDTNSRIAKRTARTATRNASSVVAEAIPYVGIGAMLAVTAYDLKDSCDTIKDLHALDVAIDPTKKFSAEDAHVCGLSVPTKDEVWQQVKSSSEEAWVGAREYLPELPDFSLPSIRVLKFW